MIRSSSLSFRKGEVGRFGLSTGKQGDESIPANMCSFLVRKETAGNDVSGPCVGFGVGE